MLRSNSVSSPLVTRLICFFWLFAKSRTRRFIFWKVVRIGTIRNDIALRCRSVAIRESCLNSRESSSDSCPATTGCSTTIDFAITSSPTRSIRASSFWISILTKLLRLVAFCFGLGFGCGSSIYLAKLGIGLSISAIGGVIFASFATSPVLPSRVLLTLSISSLVGTMIGAVLLSLRIVCSIPSTNLRRASPQPGSG
jgi:hypothetical protein